MCPLRVLLQLRGIILCIVHNPISNTNIHPAQLLQLVKEQSEEVFEVENAVGLEGVNILGKVELPLASNWILIKRLQPVISVRIINGRYALDRKWG